MPLSHYCFAHICQDPKQVLYANPDEEEDAFPILRTEDALPPPSRGVAAPDPAAAAAAAAAAGGGGGEFVAALGL